MLSEDIKVIADDLRKYEETGAIFEPLAVVQIVAMLDIFVLYARDLEMGKAPEPAECQVISLAEAMERRLKP